MRYRQKDIRPVNSKGQPHGLWELYFPSIGGWYKANYVNGVDSGYFESGSGTKIFHLI